MSAREPGDRELRELLISVTEGWYLSEESRARHADTILAAIAKAGYSVVATDRLERLVDAGVGYLNVWRMECEGDEECAWGNAGLQPGDLGAVGEGGE